MPFVSVKRNNVKFTEANSNADYVFQPVLIKVYQKEITLSRLSVYIYILYIYIYIYVYIYIRLKFVSFVSLYLYVPDEGSLLPKYRDCTTSNDFESYICIYIYILSLLKHHTTTH